MEPDYSHDNELTGDVTARLTFVYSLAAILQTLPVYFRSTSAPRESEIVGQAQKVVVLARMNMKRSVPYAEPLAKAAVVGPYSIDVSSHYLY